MKARLEFNPADCWIGVYRARRGRYLRVLHIWICIIPCFPIHVWFPGDPILNMERAAYGPAGDEDVIQ